MPYNRLNDMWKGKEQKEGTLIMHLVRSKKKKKPQTKTHLGYIIKKDPLMVVNLIYVDMFKLCGLVRLIVCG